MTQLPKELDIHDKIDYDIQFDKSFVEPLKFITDKILWRMNNSYGTQGTLGFLLMKLDRKEAFDVAHKLIMYNDFKRIDDYFRARKIEELRTYPHLSMM